MASIHSCSCWNVQCMWIKSHKNTFHYVQKVCKSIPCLTTATIVYARQPFYMCCHTYICMVKVANQYDFTFMIRKEKKWLLCAQCMLVYKQDYKTQWPLVHGSYAYMYMYMVLCAMHGSLDHTIHCELGWLYSLLYTQSPGCASCLQSYMGAASLWHTCIHVAQCNSAILAGFDCVLQGRNT